MHISGYRSHCPLTPHFPLCYRFAASGSAANENLVCLFLLPEAAAAEPEAVAAAVESQP